jgi:hypothetical protein
MVPLHVNVILYQVLTETVDEEVIDGVPSQALPFPI